ncbi:Clp protease N-terminal domain-containing protein [Rhodococcus jostii]|uniref:Clp amino terminal domain-containing protein, pathogenicity island component n=1 Tax=Rhodococcus jostii TaxID=132919 RepID=A0A1H4XQN5_RHOJO|nr:Clp protease N-terminal domain-containing protein [Rhodococcus jostii]SED08032.1 Clp amino terminal domain-containing protein, pathogenicity island component [Rhodococcus jostii]
MFERFSTDARAVVIGAQQEARELKSPQIGPEHLVLALLSVKTEPVHGILADAGIEEEKSRATVATHGTALSDADAEALESIGIDLDAVRQSLEQNFGKGVLDPEEPSEKRGWFGRKSGHIGFTRDAKKAIELSLREALARKDDHIGAEHVLLGVLRVADGTTRQILEVRVGVDELRRRVHAALDDRAA